MRERLVCAVACLVLLAFGIGHALAFNSRYVVEFDASDEAMGGIRVCASAADGSGEDEADISAQALVDQSEIIVMVRPSGVRTPCRNDTLSEVVVEKVLKGENGVLPGQTLYVYEPAYISTVQGNEVIMLSSINNIMQSGRSYILLLKVFDAPARYWGPKVDGRPYVFVDRNFGVYPLDYNEQPLVIGADSQVSYGEARAYDSISGEAGDGRIEEYRQLRGELFGILGVAEE